jgi:S-(hydroxymethyl)glutathione dehydrogenase/alcohol dehydrogenase
LRASGQDPRVRLDGRAITQGHGIGGFAAQSLVHENQLAVVSPEMPFAPACVIGCGTVTGAGAVINSANVRVGDTAVIIGAGGVGLNAVAAARLSGALRIVAIDLDIVKLETARALGATDVIDPRSTDPVEAVRDLTGGGADHVFEFIGLETTQTQAVAMAAHGGAVHLAGLAKPGATLTIPASLEMLRAHTSISGVHMGSTNLKRDIPLFAELYLQGRFDLDPLISQEISLEEIPKAYEQLTRGGVIRSVITTF